MRIISKDHDYYDCVQRMGQDLDTVYVRKREKVELPLTDWRRRGRDDDSWPFPKFQNWNTHRSMIWYHQQVIGFCGKIYPMVVVENLRGASAFCYSADEIASFVEENYRDKEYTAFMNITRRYVDPNYRKWSDVGYKRLVKHFDDVDAVADRYEEFFHQYNVPIFRAVLSDEPWRDPHVIELNPVLKDVEFYRVVDTNTAFQEVQMFFGGVLRQGDGHKPKYDGEVVNAGIDDRTMRDIKGFDDRSFKKEPTKNK